MIYRYILFSFILAAIALIVWYAIDVFFLAFATILLAILLNAIGRGTRKVTRLPYALSLIIGLIFIAGIFALIFWLYSPTIAQQFQLLIKLLPEAASTVSKTIVPYLHQEFFAPESLKNELTFFNQTFLKQFLTFFSSTISFFVSFAIFLIVGFYLALMPNRYMKGALFLIPQKNKERVWSIIQHISRSLRFWILGKVSAMICVGILVFIGLWLLDISLAFILGLLAGLLTFIPYVGPIVASIPGILIAFAQEPISALYVLLLYIGIYGAEGYFITPFIEQKTVAMPPALTIMMQILLFVLIGGLGIALATPLLVVLIAFIVSVKASRGSSREGIK